MEPIQFEFKYRKYVRAHIEIGESNPTRTFFAFWFDSHLQSSAVQFIYATSDKKNKNQRETDQLLNTLGARKHAVKAVHLLADIGDNDLARTNNLEEEQLFVFASIPF